MNKPLPPVSNEFPQPEEPYTTADFRRLLKGMLPGESFPVEKDDLRKVREAAEYLCYNIRYEMHYDIRPDRSAGHPRVWLTGYQPEGVSLLSTLSGFLGEWANQQSADDVWEGTAPVLAKLLRKVSAYIPESGLDSPRRLGRCLSELSSQVGWAAITKADSHHGNTYWISLKALRASPAASESSPASSNGSVYAAPQGPASAPPLVPVEPALAN